MAASRAWDRVTGWDFNVLPLVRGEVVHCSLIGPIALLEASENDHLGRVVVNDSRVLVAEKHLGTAGAEHRPTHGTQVQIEQLISKQVFVVVRLNTISSRYVTSEKVHIVLPDDRCVIGDVTRDVSSVA